jgi:hypothetical protein
MAADALPAAVGTIRHRAEAAITRAGVVDTPAAAGIPEAVVATPAVVAADILVVAVTAVAITKKLRDVSL